MADAIRNGDHVRGQYVGAFLEVATASGNDDGQHIPMATAAHTTRYDLQADMVADGIPQR